MTQTHTDDDSTKAVGWRQAVQPMDKRIHFALNCGARSCPPIRVYTPEELEEGLDAAAAAFCEGEPPPPPRGPRSAAVCAPGVDHSKLEVACMHVKGTRKLLGRKQVSITE